MNYKNKTVCVVDNGLFIETAIRLVRDFGKVFYYCPWESGYPKSNTEMIGKGVPGVNHVDSIWPILNDVDLFVFPDVYQGPLQVHLDNMGKRVFGGRMGEELELDRAASKAHCKKLGIDIGPWRTVKGLEALRSWLMEHENQFVKVSCLRGDMETFQSVNYKLIEPRLDELEYKLGAKKKVMDFIVEDAIPDAVEVGYDGFTIDGKFAQNTMFGIEVKDKGLIMQTTKYDKLPIQMRSVNDKLASTFANYKYRGFFSSEVRCTKDGKAYLIDPCARMGSPPGELMLYMVKNWADILWEGAGGTVVEPEFMDKWGAEILIISDWGDENWLPLEFPMSIRENVKLRYLTIIEGKHYVIPQVVGHPEVGAVVATGPTMEAAISACSQLAEQVEGYFTDVPIEAVEDAAAEFAKLKDYGVNAGG